ncbi:MAG: permease [Acidobacteriota bacterium]
MRPALFNPRSKSLARGNILVLGSLLAAIRISHAPNLRPTAWLILPALGSILGMAETARCLQRRWSFYHAAILLFLNMDLLAVTMILFFLLYPYFF